MAASAAFAVFCLAVSNSLVSLVMLFFVLLTAVSASLFSLVANAKATLALLKLSFASIAFCWDALRLLIA
ncbi:hypothetical protein D3C86_1821570 [compost metagenome]